MTMEMTKKINDVWIFDAIRTPRGKGKKEGALAHITPQDLLKTLYHALEQRNSLNPSFVDDVILGCVTAVTDQGGNIAKSSTLNAGWPNSISGLTLNRFCTSGLEACNLAAAQIASGMVDLALAGGVESMSRVPMGSDGGPPLAIHMGISADLIATLEGFTRTELDEFAVASHQNAQRATLEGYFNKSMIPVLNRNQSIALSKDEWIRPNTSMDQLSQLKSYFQDIGASGQDAIAIQKYPQINHVNHLHHAGNSPAISDGAALVLMGSSSKGRELGLKPRARICSFGQGSGEPILMLTGAQIAAKKALQKAGLSPKDIDLFEVNESFAAPVLKFQRDLEINPALLNVNGGAIALGHPLGATGAILLGTLLDELERRDHRYGLVALCGGAGLGVATVIERVL